MIPPSRPRNGLSVTGAPIRTLALLALVLATLAPVKPPASAPPPAAAPPPHPHVAGYRSDEKVPQRLLDAYVKFAEVAQSAQSERDIRPLLLPHAVDITTGGRPDKTREYGSNINVPFLRSGFNPKVFSVRRDADDAWLIRTGSSAIWFVETKSGAWRVYQYLDKPIN